MSLCRDIRRPPYLPINRMQTLPNQEALNSRTLACMHTLPCGGTEPRHSRCLQKPFAKKRMCSV